MFEEPTMNIKTYCVLSALLFTLVALAHLVRLINGWPVQVGGMTVPMTVSWFGLAVTAGLAFWGFRESRAAS